MSVLETIGGRVSSFLDQRAELTAARENLALERERVEESLRALALEDRGWASLSATYSDVPDRATLTSNADLVRALAIAHPLVVRAKAVRGAYVFGEGVTITAHTEAEKNPVDLDAIVQEYIQDAGNAAAVFGHTAALEREGDLFADGNVFLGHWVNPRTGDVRVRAVPFTEIVDIRTADGDYATPTLYLRRWSVGTTHHAAWLPDVDYAPSAKLKAIDGIPILWPGTTHPTLGNGCAVLHVRVNPVGRTGVWGVGDGWPALTWARRHADFLADTAALYAALTKIARVISGGPNKSQAMRAAAGAAAGPAGGSLVGDALQVQTPSFAGVDPKLGRPYAAMVASAVGVPVTVLTADPGQEGARAVAETLDRPMRLGFQARQRVWADAWRASISFKLRQAVRAPLHPLKGTIRQVEDRQIIDWPEGQAPIIDTHFPDIQDDNLEALIDALVAADGTGKVHPLVIARGLLQALQVEDVEGELEKLVDENGEWADPSAGIDAQTAAAAEKARAWGVA